MWSSESEEELKRARTLRKLQALGYAGAAKSADSRLSDDLGTVAALADPHELRYLFDLFGVATDDFHYYQGGDISPGRGWIMVRARYLTPEHLLRAIKAGDFYASSGVADGGALITHRLPFTETINAYELHRTREDGAVKIVIQMPSDK